MYPFVNWIHVFHDIAGNDMVEHFTGDGCDLYLAVVVGVQMVSFFEYGDHTGCGPCSL